MKLVLGGVGNLRKRFWLPPGGIHSLNWIEGRAGSFCVVSDF